MTDWPVKTLGDLLEVSIGGIWGNEAGEDQVDVFVYRSTELIKDGQLKEELTVRRSVTARQLDSRKLEEGDLLLEKSGGGPKTPVGRVGLVKVLPGLSVCSNFMQLMRPRKEDVLPVYLHYFLNHFHVAGHTEDLQNNSTNIRNLKTTEYMEVEIPVPPLEEQKRIVALLDKATARVTELTACYEQARTHSNNLFTSALRDALEGNPDWPVKTLGEVCEFQNGYAFESSEYVRNGHALIRIKNVQQGEIVLSDDVFVQIPKDGSLNQFVLNSGDILMSLTGYLGRVGRLDATDLPAALNQRVAKVSVKSKASLFDGFLYRVLDSQWFRDQVEVYGRGAAQQNVGTSDISKIEIPMPPLEEQKRIVARLDSMKAKTSGMVAAYDAKLTTAKNLRQSILESAFEGKL